MCSIQQQGMVVVKHLGPQVGVRTMFMLLASARACGRGRWQGGGVHDGR
jgi:hypothetical protein